MNGLDIQGLARLGASIGFSLAGNAKVPITLNLRGGAGAYDPVTDTYTAAAPAEIQVEAVEFKRKNVQERQASLMDPASNRDLNKETKTYLVQAADVGGVNISQEDTVKDAQGRTWGIMSAAPDPGRATWLLDVILQ